VRREPRDDAEQVTQLLAGEPVTALEERGGWTRIETAYAYPGWVRSEALGPPGEGPWPPVSGGDVLAEARAYLGSPYEWGGMSERGIDCSGLVHMAFRRVGRVIPRDSSQQEGAGEPVVAGDDLRPGDLLCYPDHVAFWLGDGRILHASGREGVGAVVEEPEPPELFAQRRALRRIETNVTT
jgi:cell wall-associated NlpC family hydrolase